MGGKLFIRTAKAVFAGFLALSLLAWPLPLRAEEPA